MGASRKLQGEIDRVLKKVQEGVDVFDSIWNKVYDTENVNQKEKFEADLKKEIKKLQRYRDQIKTWIQSSEIKDKKALMDARKQIEREMERFKICEKETKTKAFSKEGLGQQPKTDPKEKAKSETRDWLNNVVGDLETQIESFEAEIEAISVKKGKTRPPRLTHLETSILRHKAHIIKLELILRLLDNDELSPEEVNDVKDFLDDYVERNQDDPDDFCDVEEFYNSLPLEKVESLEDLVASGPSALVKGVGSVSATSAGLSLKGSVANSSTQGPAAQTSPSQQSSSAQDQYEETASLDSNSDIPKVIPKGGTIGSLISSSSSSIVSGATGGTTSAASGNITPRSFIVDSMAAAVVSGPAAVRSVLENPAAAAVAAAALSSVNPSSSVKNDDNISFLSRRSSPAPSEIAIGRGTGRGPMVGVAPNQASSSVPVSLGSVGAVTGTGSFGVVPAASDIVQRNTLGSDERTESCNLSQTLVSPLSSRVLLQQGSKSSDAIVSADTTNVGEGAVIGGRVFSPSVVSGAQWRPPSLNSFQNQNEMGQFRGRTEITPDQREKFLQRLQQVQQQGPSNLLNAAHLSGANQKQFTTQQQNSLLQQFNSQNSSTQVGIGLQSPILGNVKPASQQQQQPNAVHHQSTQQGSLTSGPRDSAEGHQQNSSDDFNVEPLMSSGPNKAVINDDDMKSPYMAVSSASVIESSQLPRDTDLSPGQPLQPIQSSASLGVIGRRSISDLGAIGDNISGSVGSSGAMHDDVYNSQMLEAAYYKLPQPKDSERVKNYIPRRPAVTPSSYPQVQAPVVDNPAFWERLGLDNMGTDTLFFAFYYQQNTYQQYLAAKELKRQSWRYHRKYHTWFQRHEEPKITTDDYEQGTYVYFDFHIADDNLQHGWCQRIKTDFTFEYSYLEDELVV